MRDPKKFLAEFGKRADNEMAAFTVSNLYTLIDLEVSGAARFTVLTRLHRRLCTQRAKAERANLAKNRTKWRV